MSNIVTQSSQNQLQEIVPLSKKELLRDMICKGASDNELQLFMDICNKTGLDPFSKQCWAVKRWDKSLGREVMAFQTGVDGFRVIANRSNKYSGQVGPFWCGEDGKWHDVWLKNTPPIAAKVGVLRTDFKEPLWAVAKFTSYAATSRDGKLTQFWSKMPDLMIAKVAECLALRKAFPQDLSGIYSSEEMEQAELKDVTPKDNNGNKNNNKPLQEPQKEKSEAQVDEAPQAPINHAPQTQEDAANWKPQGEITYQNFVIRSKGENNGKTFAECHQGELESYIDAMIFHFLNKELPDNVRLLFSMYRDYLASKGMVKDSLKNILK